MSTALEQVFCRPGRRYNGKLVCSLDGVSFTPPNITSFSQVVSFPCSIVERGFSCYNNQTNLFIIHFHLSSIISIGKTETKEIQFCKKLNGTKEKNEAQKSLMEAFMEETSLLMSETANPFSFENVIDTEISGIKVKEQTSLQRTQNHLVSVTDKPFYVCAIKELDTIILERSTKFSNFCDLTFLPKDVSRGITTFSSVAKKLCEPFVQELRDTHGIPFLSLGASLNWKTLTKTLLSEPTPRPSFSELIGDQDEEEGHAGEEEEEEEEEESFELEEAEGSSEHIESDDEDVGETQSKLKNLRL